MMSPNAKMIQWRWDGDAMVPEPRFANLADRVFMVDEVYRLEAVEEAEWGRSRRSHNHQFAWVHDLWLTLSERLKDAPWAQSPETLRKHALIMTGWCDTSSTIAGSNAAARAVAATIEGFARQAHGYAIVSVSGKAVVCKTPRSQKESVMGKKEFLRSKADVLAWIEDILEVERGTAGDMAGRIA